MIIRRKPEASQALHTQMKTLIFEGLIREHRRMKVREIAKVTGISKSFDHKIICKFSSHWMPKMLFKSHKTNRMSAFYTKIETIDLDVETFRLPSSQKIEN